MPSLARPQPGNGVAACGGLQRQAGRKAPGGHHGPLLPAGKLLQGNAGVQQGAGCVGAIRNRQHIGRKQRP